MTKDTKKKKEEEEEEEKKKKKKKKKRKIKKEKHKRTSPNDNDQQLDLPQPSTETIIENRKSSKRSVKNSKNRKQKQTKSRKDSESPKAKIATEKMNYPTGGNAKQVEANPRTIENKVEYGTGHGISGTQVNDSVSAMALWWRNVTKWLCCVQGSSSNNNNNNMTKTKKTKWLHPSSKMWKVQKIMFTGAINYERVGRFEEINGQDIQNGLQEFQKHPDKYIAFAYSESLNQRHIPPSQQKYYLTHRKGTMGLHPVQNPGNNPMTMLVHANIHGNVGMQNVPLHAPKDQYTDTAPLRNYQGQALKEPSKTPSRGIGWLDNPRLVLFGNTSVDPSDIHQGSCLGDCWLLSSIACMAEYEPACKRLFRETKRSLSELGSLYTVTLWDLTTWTEVDIVIDERLLVQENGTLFGCKPSETGKLWPAYLEKAFAAHCGGWDQLTDGQPTHGWAMLTGCKEQYTIRRAPGSNDNASKWHCHGKFHPTEQKWKYSSNASRDDKQIWRMPWPGKGINMKDIVESSNGGMEMLNELLKELTDDELFSEMRKWRRKHYMVAAVTKGTKNSNITNGLADYHAFSILAVHGNVAGSGVDLLKVRNPWSRGEMDKGQFVDAKAPGWTQYPQIVKELQPNFDEGDGVFWISKQEFFIYFQDIFVCAVDMTTLQ